MRLFHVIGIDDLFVNRLGIFYMINDNNEIVKIDIPKHLTKIFAKYVINTFIGPLNGDVIFKNDNICDISLENLMYDLTVVQKNDTIFMINGEEFKQIPGYDNYYISQNGVVYSRSSNKVLKIKINPWMYYTIGITNNNGQRKFEMIHRLVYETWVGPIDNTLQVNHKNSKPWINSLYNLELTSAIENVRHSIQFNNRYSKWKVDDVYNVCSYLADGFSADEIYRKLDLDAFIKLKHFRSFCSYLKSKTKYWTDVSSQFDFDGAHVRFRKYDDALINGVLKMLKANIPQKEIADHYNIDFRVVSEIKRGIKKPHVYYE